MRIFGRALGRTAAAVAPDRDGIEALARPAAASSGPFFQQIVERGRCPLLVIEALCPDQTIVYASPAIEELTGYPPEELVGRDWRRFLTGAAELPCPDPMPGATGCGFAARERFRMRHRDGAELCLDVKLSQLGADPAFATHYIAVLHDLTAACRTREAPEHRARREPSGVAAPQAGACQRAMMSAGS